MKAVRGVCLDIDDTLSTEGKLTADAFAALWKLKKAGFVVVPITGRPAGWCDHIARFWPVDAVVGENGAFTFFMREGVLRRLETPMQFSREEARARLTGLEAKVREEFPEARWASDQPYRDYDLAIDIREDVKAWSRGDIDRLLRLCQDEGAHAKLSSIHVNAWFGDYDKRKGFLQALNSGALGDDELDLSRWLYIGDSPNDEPMFELFPLSVGVANLKPYLDRLKMPPAYLTIRSSGGGFVEMAKRLLAV